jgi:hypothetical protein
MQKARKSGSDVEVRPRPNCIKSEVEGQLGILLEEIERWRTKLKIGENP